MKDGRLLETNRELPDNADGRSVGDYCSRYPRSAWLQIVSELIYLLVILIGATSCLLIIGYDVNRDPGDTGLVAYYFEFPRHRSLLVWITIGLAGVSGGAAFSLKWLYHSVAKFIWNRDRVLWRITVPVLSGVLAVFLGFMIVSGLIPFLNKKSFDNFYIAMGYGFFSGYFSDNVLAALQRLARNTFGTADGKHGEADKTHPAKSDE